MPIETSVARMQPKRNTGDRSNALSRITKHISRKDAEYAKGFSATNLKWDSLGVGLACEAT